MAVVTIDRPKALNALNLDVLRELYDTMELLDGDSSVKVVIVTGVGEKAFVAGADIASMSTMTPEEALAFAETGHRTMNRIAAMKKVTIAAINGFALGGGCELEQRAFALTFATADQKEGMSAFLEKRPANFL